MKHSDGGLGGSFTVDGKEVEVDLAEFGWDTERHGQENADRTSAEDEGTVRLQKALAHAGVASRRACEAIISGGRVTVNGETVHELGSRINTATDEVRVDGVIVQLDVSKRYFVLNKPCGVVSTMADENGKPDLREFTASVEAEHDRDPANADEGALRLYNVGRLDTDTSGLLVLTNDGELAHKLAHPSFEVQKTYIAKVRGRLTPAVIQRLKDGIELSDGPIHADSAKLLPGGSGQTHSLVELTLHSGRNRIVRRMLADVGHPVVELVRRQFGPLHLGSMKIGELRELSAAERGALLSANDLRSANDQRRAHDKRGAQEVTAGRPGDGKGAKGMRGVAAKGTARMKPRSGRPRNEGA